MVLKMSSCMAWMARPFSLPYALMASAKSANARSDSSIVICIIMQNMSSRMVWETPTMLTFRSAQNVETFAKMPTVSLPTTVMTARMVRSSKD